jgi:ribosomal protein L32
MSEAKSPWLTFVRTTTDAQRKQMPHWVPGCPNCKSDLDIWKIPDTSIVEFFLPSKPVLPVDGLARRCPNCGHDGVYHRTNVNLNRAFGFCRECTSHESVRTLNR